MPPARMLRLFILCALLLGLLPPQSARAAPAWTPAAPTQATHFDYSAVLLPNAPEQTDYSPRGLAFIVYTNGRYEVKSFGP